MGIFGACAIFLVLILVYIVIEEVFTVLFRFTGLPVEKSRFQVISLLTGCGFTTRESEIIISSRSRRKLARVTMLFGYVFNVTIVSALVNIFLSLKESELKSILWSLPVPLLVFAALVLLARVQSVRSWFNRQIEALVGRLVRRERKNQVLLLDYVGSLTIAQVNLKQVPGQLRGLELKDTGLRGENNVMVMLCERRGADPVSAAADTILEDAAGDAGH